MDWLRNRIRQWLGVPTREQIRALVLREIDADAVWREAPSLITRANRRVEKGREREAAIYFGGREDTRG